MQSDDKKRRRDHLGIIADILLIASQGAKKTQIMYRANLSFTQLDENIDLLRNKGLLIQTIYDGKELYFATKRGQSFLRQHRALIRMLESQNTRETEKASVQSLLIEKT